ncbi:MAG: TonB-dependent receptor, partial [Saprospiraceae bacterium]
STDFNGSYQIEVTPGAYTIEFSYIGYETQQQQITLAAGENLTLDANLTTTTTLLQTATVTSGRYEKPLSEVTVSLEVIKPALVESVNSTSVDEVLEKVPGVTIVDGQANIRGGSGYSYGAGSRVLLMVDDIPILAGDSGASNWDDIPVENIEQIEVIKGAASALYGSSALNGIINVRTGYAKNEPETKISTFYKYYADPADEKRIWWEDGERPREFGGSILHRRKIGKFDLNIGGFHLNRNDINDSTSTRYARVNLGTRYRITDRLSVGLNANVNRRNTSNFFFWQDAEAGIYRPAAGTVSTTDATRFNIDPFVTYFAENGARHRIITRWLSLNNEANQGNSNSSNYLYGEYQFQYPFDFGMVATAGVVTGNTNSDSELFGDTTFTANNLAFYAQVEQKLFEKLNLSGGFRYERNRLNNPGFTYNNGLNDVTIAPSDETEAKPVFRLGLNYQVAEYTFLRASWGQGYRFPTIAEKFITTQFGGVPISPNPDLTSETGFSTEIGIKQGFRVSNVEGFIDVSAFWSEYQDMMEFTFVNLFPTGFQSQNIGDTDIKGIDVSIAGRGNLGSVPITFLTGYTFINPLFKEFDTTPVVRGEDPTEGQTNARNSSVDFNILKYRSRHSVKFDLEGQIKQLTIGASAIYNSQIEAVDLIFEALVVPGLTDFRAANANGYTVLGLRAAYNFTPQIKLSLIGNNLLNVGYSVRPGLLEAGRTFTVRLDMKF